MAIIDFGGERETVVTRKEFSLATARKVLKKETIAIIGYGVQGPAQALNLRDNGFNVIVGQSKKFIKDWNRAKKDIPDVEERIAKGDLITLRDWLQKKIHRPGRTYPVPELIRRATGRKPSPTDFVEYIETKYGELYDL